MTVLDFLTDGLLTLSRPLLLKAAGVPMKSNFHESEDKQESGFFFLVCSWGHTGTLSPYRPTVPMEEACH